MTKTQSSIRFIVALCLTTVALTSFPAAGQSTGAAVELDPAALHLRVGSIQLDPATSLHVAATVAPGHESRVRRAPAGKP
jgi:hypothetical protein